MSTEHGSGNVLSVFSVLFSGAGGALLVWLFQYFFDQPPSPSYCEEVYTKKYNNLKSLENTLLIKAKENLLKNNFRAKLENISKENSKLKELIIHSSIDYMEGESIFFNSKELGKSCISIDEKRYIKSFEKHLFEKQEISGSFQLRNISVIYEGKIDSFINKKVKEAIINSLKERYNKLEGSVLNDELFDLLVHNLDYEIKKSKGNDHHINYQYDIYLSVVRLLYNSGEKEYLNSNDGYPYHSKDRIGFDSRKKYAYFKIIYLSDEYNWKIGSLDLIGKIENGEYHSKNISQEIGNKYFKRYITSNNIQNLIVVGTASCEGNPFVEKKRAELRTQQMAYWFSKHYKNLNKDNEMVLSILNLGKYEGVCNKKNTSSQRKFVIIGITNIENGVDVKEALEDALRNTDSPLDINNYSNFEYTEKFQLDQNSFENKKLQFIKLFGHYD